MKSDFCYTHKNLPIRALPVITGGAMMVQNNCPLINRCEYAFRQCATILLKKLCQKMRLRQKMVNSLKF